MNYTALGLLTGLALGFAGAFGGFGAFLIVALLGAVGLAVGRWLDGHHDLARLAETARERER
ncbi:hypothetical protein [Salinifilum ghardaiensis]